MIKRFKDFLNEFLKDNKFLKGDKFLYHYTSLESLKDILKSNKMVGRISIDLEDFNLDSIYQDKPYISFTRNKNFHLESDNESISLECRITFDANKLENKYSLKPYEYSIEIGDEFEERIVFLKGDAIQNIKNYISKITIFQKSFENFEESELDKIQKLANNIPIDIDSIKIYDYFQLHKTLIYSSSKNEIYKRGDFEFEDELKTSGLEKVEKNHFYSILKICRKYFKTSLINVKHKVFELLCEKDGFSFTLSVKLSFERPRIDEDYFVNPIFLKNLNFKKLLGLVKDDISSYITSQG